ncbi:MAG: type I DNA topoisomerase [Kiritimatiellae bacterium]|jgi:DNA topoisomerase-1|nr:type I DNA topoisomerase [Kiritimatiellia bacterium]
MAKNLVIVESPTKASTINKMLGKDYIVLASMGHIRDLPVKALGVDIQNSFTPKYVSVKGHKRVLDDIKKAAKECENVYLAPDPDREGEAIAWHLREVLNTGKDRPNIFRIKYNEITPTAVKHAIENPCELDDNVFYSQQARRILDRIVGYQVSPMLWRRLKRGLSAGRVQSVALRLISEREREILKFIPEPFWVYGAAVKKQIKTTEPFTIDLVKIDNKDAEVKDKELAEKVHADLKSSNLNVKSITNRTVKRKAPAPFITSTMQQTASNVYSFSPKRTMSLAQSLYEGIDFGSGHIGLITYMRTDSFNVSKDAQGACKTFITDKFGSEFLPAKPNFYKSRNSAQEAHEAIRPTDVNITPEVLRTKLPPAELKLYTLIWKRFVASQMNEAHIAQKTIDIDAKPGNGSSSQYTLRVSTSEVTFPGFMKVAGLPKPPKTKDGKDKIIPPLKEGEALDCIEWIIDEKETKPPPRFNNASLISTLEKNGIGRPSTYSQIIGTLQSRSYAEIKKQVIYPTDLGLQVNDMLMETLSELFDVAFTANMESALDDVEAGETGWVNMLSDFYRKFEAWMEKTKAPPAKKKDVGKVLEMLAQITEWREPLKRGKRLYSDKSFFESIQKQYTEGKKDVSVKQLESLITMAIRYKEQIENAIEGLQEAGYSDFIEKVENAKPDETTIGKMKLLDGMDLDESATAFVDSLKMHLHAGKILSEAQTKALDRIIISHAKQIKNLEEVQDNLNLQKEDFKDDKESKIMLDALANVEEWKPATTRGKRKFDDFGFYTSLKEHFDRKGFLSERQAGALKRMLLRYKAQIPKFETVAEEIGLDLPEGRL